jgi:hypothetical protein
LLAVGGSLKSRREANVLGRVLRGALLLCALTAATAHAQKRSEAPGPEGKSGPPVAVSGFRYQHMPPRIHMNVCESATCTLGSKVSYLFMAPSPRPTFEQYQAERTKIADALRLRVAPGATITFDPPQQTKDKVFTIFKARRVDAFPNGSKLFVWSQRVYGARMAFEIISSSPDEKAAEGNLALFTVPMMVLSRMKGEPPKDR